MQSRQTPDHSIRPASTIKGAPRIEDRKITIYNKNGEPEEVERDNARDLIQHHGYTQKPKSAAALVEDDEAEESAAGAKKISPKPIVEELPDTAKEIIALRERLEAAGVKIDARWGLKRLREVAADLGAAGGQP